MKKTIPLYAILLSISSLFLSNGFAQDHTQWDLPEGAKIRIGDSTHYLKVGASAS